VQDARYLRKVKGKLEEDLETKWLLERRMEMNRKIERKKMCNFKEREKYREVVMDEHTALVLNRTKEMDSIVVKTQKVARSILTLHQQENAQEKYLADKYINSRKQNLSKSKVRLQPKLDVKPRVENMNKLDQLIHTALQNFGSSHRSEMMKTDHNLTASTFRSTRRQNESQSLDRLGSSRTRLASLDKTNDAKCIEILW